MMSVQPRQLPLNGDKCGQLARELLLRGPLMVALSVGLAALQPTVASGQGDAPPASDEPAAPHEEVTGGRTIGDGEIRLGAAVNAGILTGRPTVTAVRTDTPPIVDGRLDDAVWRRAARITDFVQRQPVDGAPATEDTEVYVAYDSANIYLGFHAHYSDPRIMRANRTDRDRAGFSDDLFVVYFDTFLDQQRAYVFSRKRPRRSGRLDPRRRLRRWRSWRLRRWRSDWRQFVERAVQLRWGDRRRWVHGRAGDSVQEPSVPVEVREHAPSLGISGGPAHPRKG